MTRNEHSSISLDYNLMLHNMIVKRVCGRKKGLFVEIVLFRMPENPSTTADFIQRHYHQTAECLLTINKQVGIKARDSSGDLNKLLAPLYKCAKGWTDSINEPVAFLARAFLILAG